MKWNCLRNDDNCSDLYKVEYVYIFAKIIRIMVSVMDSLLQFYIKNIKKSIYRENFAPE